MNDELYNLWTRRADVEVPADFADRIMDAVRREPPPSKRVLILMRFSPGLRVAACALACVVCLFRMAAVVAVFFAQ
jgi:hypothetical protein